MGGGRFIIVPYPETTVLMRREIGEGRVRTPLEICWAVPFFKRVQRIPSFRRRKIMLSGECSPERAYHCFLCFYHLSAPGIYPRKAKAFARLQWDREADFLTHEGKV